MNDFQRHIKQLDPSPGSRSEAAQTARQVAIYSLSALIVSGMLVWFGFLGWGFVAMLHWILDCVKSLWAK